MKTHSLVIILSVFFMTLNAQGQSESDIPASPKNALKINILPPLLSATSEISYERLIWQNTSVVAGIGGNWSGNRSDFVLFSDADLSFLNRDISNRYFLAEMRHYLDFNDCKPLPPHGFYVGGFMRYNSVDISSDVQFGSNVTNLETEINVDFKSFNFGALVGYQISHNNWLIDFEFGGLGYAPNWVDFTSSSTLSRNELDLLSDAFSRNFGIGGNYRQIELNSSSAEINFWYWAFRYAVSIGYSF